MSTPKHIRHGSRLGTEATAENILALSPYAVVFASGSEVCVVDFAPMFPLDSLTGGERFMMEAKLETEHCMEKGIPLHYDSAVTKYEGGKLYLKHTQTGEESSVEADTVVLSTGVKPADGLYNALLAAGVPNVWKTGDANRCAKIVNAVQAGSKFGVGLN